MKKVSFSVSLILVFFCFSLSSIAEIAVKDVKGREMSIKVLGYTKSTGEVKMSRSDGQVFVVNLNVFDTESQGKIIAAAPPERARLAISVSAGKRRERKGDSSYMKNQTVTAKAKVENESRKINFSKGKGTVILVARQTARFANRDEDYGKILLKQQFNIDVEAGREFEYECKPLVTSYDSDKDSSNVGGWMYYGYVFIVQNEDGTIASATTSIGNLQKTVEEVPEASRKLLALSEGAVVQKNLSAR